MVPYLTLMRQDAPQRDHSVREAFNGLRYIVCTGVQGHMMPDDLPPWHAAYQQTQHWLKAGVFEDMGRDLRMLMREIEDRVPQPRAAILDSRTLQSSPERGARAVYGEQQALPVACPLHTTRHCVQLSTVAGRCTIPF
jgi:transposase